MKTYYFKTPIIYKMYISFDHHGHNILSDDLFIYRPNTLHVYSGSAC